jgi:hypothetical protein
MHGALQKTVVSARVIVYRCLSTTMTMVQVWQQIMVHYAVASNIYLVQMELFAKRVHFFRDVAIGLLKVFNLLTFGFYYLSQII